MPNVSVGVVPVSVSVPGATAGSVAAAPKLMTPCEPLLAATLALTALTAPLFDMVSAPLPKFPTVRVPEFVHVEPTPSTVTVPRDFAPEPIVPAVSETAPLFVMSSLPMPEVPTESSLLLVQREPQPLTETVPVPVVS
ncbi:hypothetical protein D9M71_693420 [compost metagenome]